MKSGQPTQFAPGQRAAQATLLRQRDYFTTNALPRRLLDALPGMLFVLNDQRQILYVNHAVVELVGAAGESSCIGLRVGELLGCEHVREVSGGCGTSEYCSTCGAILSILSGLSGTPDVKECRLTRTRHDRIESLDLRAVATPFEHQGERFVILAVNDISDEKRRQALERVFYHDVLNLVGSVKGFAELLLTYDMANKEEIYQLVHEASELVIDEIEAQRLLLSAESGTLRPQRDLVDAESLLTRLTAIYRYHQVANERQLVLEPIGGPLLLNSDRVVLGRILGNMMKNALEATAPGGTVSVRCSRQGEQVEFAVHNVGVMPRSVQLQIFKRYFSTKGEHRGLGTYSMRLFSEYLGGRIFFTSDERLGTTFCLRIPVLYDSP